MPQLAASRGISNELTANFNPYWKLITGMNVPSRVAKFFLVQNTNAGKNIPNGHKNYLTGVK
jgi:hypothetical protein